MFLPLLTVWEELHGRHFFTLMVQRRALLEGAEFADQMSDHKAATFYREQGTQILSALQAFWDDEGQYVTAYRVHGRSGVDCSTLLGALKGWNQSSITSSLDEAQFGPATQRILATVYKYLAVFRSLYPLNRNRPAPQPALTGRYPEDEYAGFQRTGGNPWYLCTLATAEVLDSASKTFEQAQKLHVTNATQAFFAQWVPDLGLGGVHKDTHDFDILTRGMRALAAGMRDLIQLFAHPNGSMSEQIHFRTGKNVGARELTWNYAAWLSARRAAPEGLVF